MPPACPVLQRSLLVLHGTPPKPQMLGPLAQAVALAQQYCPAPLGTAPGGVVRGQVQKFPVLDACPVAHVASAGKSAHAENGSEHSKAAENHGARARTIKDTGSVDATSIAGGVQTARKRRIA